MQPIQCLWFSEDRLSERWRIFVTNWPRFVDAVGLDVLTQFACCFVHADRLTSLVNFGYLSEKQFGRKSTAFKRDLQTMVWFIAGTLREFTLASTGLRAALAKRDLLIRIGEPWIKLREVEDRWNDDPRYRDLRNKVAYHVAPDAVQAGLEVFRDQDRVDIAEGDGSMQHNVSAHIGILAAIAGTVGGDFTKKEGFLAEFAEIMRSLSKDLGTPTVVIHNLFLDVMQQVGFVPLRMREAFKPDPDEPTLTTDTSGF